MISEPVLTNSLSSASKLDVVENLHSSSVALKIILLAGGSSIHAIRWANGFAAAGLEVVFVSQHDLLEAVVSGVRFIRLPYSGNIGYFLNAKALRKILEKEQPDVLNAHYASGYGTTMRLASSTPSVLSVWGSDVYDFPRKSLFHRWLLKRNLAAATVVASTSMVMAEQTRTIYSAVADISITPFGVDVQRFCPRLPRNDDAQPKLVIGTVKSLAFKYGIDTLLDAFSQLLRKMEKATPEIARRLELRIVGEGPCRQMLINQAQALGIAEQTHFLGHINHDLIPQELHKFDVYVALSRLDSESFGVAVIEASACGLPVVVSDAGGLPEVVVDGQTGYVIPRDNATAAAEALEKLIQNEQIRQAMGEAGRNHVMSRYEWKQNVKDMIVVLKKAVCLNRGNC